MAPGLYVVATPIGHLSDLSPRAAQVLCDVDVVAAEDTRVTRVLLAHVGSSARLIGARAHNEAQAAEAIIALLAQGQSVALVSDAGTPAISDPGARVVAAVRAAGHAVVPVPGPSAIITLLSAAGLADGPVLFEGFLPSRPRARRERLEALAAAADAVSAALVLYEAPHRIVALVDDLLAHYGGQRGLVIGRELTKLHEEIAVMPLAQAPAWLTAGPHRQRGEFVLALAQAPADDAAATATASAGIDAQTRRLLTLLATELPPARAARLAHEISGTPREALYRLALSLPLKDPP
ncbi:MAG: 16S rRNA (cytidine(1402)-2'-O)-methyltransferase [Burkholderiales bacterium]|jgi:16S rRNA (cytidine1402-2'-O)-methyltransferase